MHGKLAELSACPDVARVLGELESRGPARVISQVSAAPTTTPMSVSVKATCPWPA